MARRLEPTAVWAGLATQERSGQVGAALAPSRPSASAGDKRGVTAPRRIRMFSWTDLERSNSPLNKMNTHCKVQKCLLIVDTEEV